MFNIIDTIEEEVRGKGSRANGLTKESETISEFDWDVGRVIVGGMGCC